ncbi:DUF2306 domain-containing protein [Tateyamaria sp. SN6-1]|uniref:DUF2306 domain-containing protein n=1 Tax=Tateyamaria sp. SN6-1 TaxID=3092148 RepID=UPI0039F53C32
MRRARTIWALVGLGLLFLAVQEFSWYALWRGVGGLSGDAAARGRLAGTATSDLAIFGHMVLGGVITLLAVVQWAGPLRRRWPRLHRVSGRTLAPLALITAVSGLIYIALRGTIGGPIMSVGFALYGGLMAVAAVQTYRHARAHAIDAHRAWGLRLIVLCLGSWIYRVHYGIWYGITCTWGEATCRLGSRSDFSGVFDQIQVFAFYLPYLLIVEWHLRRTGGAGGRVSAP